MRCAVKNCGHNNNSSANRKTYRFFHFPKDEMQMSAWINFCKRDNINISTACICNVHFRSEDFERNLQYEMGFTRKNPTILKSGSCPTLHPPKMLTSNRPKTEMNLSLPKNRRSKQVFTSKDSISYNEANHNSSSKVKTINTPENVESFPKFGTNCRSSKSIQAEALELETSEEPNEEDQSNITYARMEIDIIDPLNPITNADNHIEIVNAEVDTYVTHLEVEVSTLKRKVLNLQTERTKLLNEIRKLKSTIQRNQTTASNKNFKKTAPVDKKTVMLYTADINTIKHFRQIDTLTD